MPEYIAIRKELETLSGHIKDVLRSSTGSDPLPQQKLHPPLARRFFRVSAVGLVTPFRDGMNLVAKEYVACQDPEDPGVLVLSRFAGAAEELGDALIVNPYDIESVADALQKRPYHAIGGAQSTLRCHDGGSAAERYFPMAGEFCNRPDGSAVR